MSIGDSYEPYMDDEDRPTGPGYMGVLMVNWRTQHVGTVTGIGGEELAVSVAWDPDQEPEEGYPVVSLGDAVSLDQAGTEELARLIVAASWEAARITADPKAAEDDGNGRV